MFIEKKGGNNDRSNDILHNTDRNKRFTLYTCINSNSWSTIDLHFNPWFATDDIISHYQVGSKGRNFCGRELCLYVHILISHTSLTLFYNRVLYLGILKGSKEMESQIYILRFFTVSCFWGIFNKFPFLFYLIFKLCKGTESFIHRTWQFWEFCSCQVLL